MGRQESEDEFNDLLLCKWRGDREPEILNTVRNFRKQLASITFENWEGEERHIPSPSTLSFRGNELVWQWHQEHLHLTVDAAKKKVVVFDLEFECSEIFDVTNEKVLEAVLSFFAPSE